MKPKKTQLLEQGIATLKRKLMEAEAAQAHVYHFAKHGILGASREKAKGGGLIVRMHWLGGKEVCLPFMLKDGLGAKTIEGLLEDFAYSFEEATVFKP